MGLAVEPGAVLYVSTEGVLHNRVTAYLKHHKLGDGRGVPFAYIESDINLFANDADTTGLPWPPKMWRSN